MKYLSPLLVPVIDCLSLFQSHLTPTYLGRGRYPGIQGRFFWIREITYFVPEAATLVQDRGKQRPIHSNPIPSSVHMLYPTRIHHCA